MAVICEYSEPDLQIHHEVNYIETATAFFPMHVHEQFELFCLVDGRANCLIESNAYPLQQGSLLLLQPGEAHKIDILEDCEYERYSIEFSEKLLDHIDPDHSLVEPFLDRDLGHDNHYPTQLFQSQPALYFFENMCAPLANEKDRRVLVLSFLFPLLCSIRRIWSDIREPAGSRNKSSVEEMIRYINRHLADDLSVPHIAQQFYMSVSQCERLFKKATGSTIWDYVLIKRLFMARSMIQQGIPSTEAYLACGFRDYSTFYRAYMKRFGISPKADRLPAGE